MYLPSYLCWFLLSTFFSFNVAQSQDGNCAALCDPKFESAARLKGTIAPIFTTFHKNGKLNLKIIPKYAEFLHKRGIKGIYIFWPDDGSFVLTLCQSKQFLKAWVTACKSLGIAVLCEVGGLPFYSVLELTRYAKELEVDAISSLPDLYFKANLTEKAVRGLAAVAKAAYPVPVMYTDRPFQTGVNLNMNKLVSMAIEKIENFGGIITSSLRIALLVQGTNKLTSKQSIFVMGSLTIASAYSYCLNGTINALNTIDPEMAISVEKAIREGNYSEAYNCQLRRNKMTAAIFNILNTDDSDLYTVPQQVALQRVIFEIRTKISVGRPPQNGPVPIATREQERQIAEVLQNAN